MSRGRAIAAGVLLLERRRDFQFFSWTTNFSVLVCVCVCAVSAVHGVSFCYLGVLLECFVSCSEVREEK